MKHILVTGCKGQLGNELQVLAPQYADTCKFFFTDKEELDITDRQAILSFVEMNGISHIINCAAFTAVDKAESEPELCELLNHTAPEYLADAAEAVGATMIQVSTDYVFDGTACRPYTETDDTCPNSVYGRTKLAGEEAVIRNCPGSMVIRTAWLYSSHGNNFVKTMLRLADSQKEVRVVSDQIGTPTYARDLACAILKVLQSHQWVAGIYHFTDEGAASWYDFAHAIFRIAGKKVKLVPIPTEDFPTPASRPAYSILDRSRIKATYGVEIPHWEESLEDCMKRILAQ